MQHGLQETGRIMNKPVSFFDTESVTIKNEMEILQCSVSFPMIHRGKLIGIFNVDNKITEEPFYSEEMEILYVLCNYLAAAVKDIDLYHNMWYQKEFTKNILSSMSSGMIAIDKDEKITIFNQQASEILNFLLIGYYRKRSEIIALSIGGHFIRDDGDRETHIRDTK